jgi:SEC-C motif-containing protein
MTPAATDLPCPCDPTRRYRDCCGPLHSGVPARDAEALMRSRYSAYAMGLEDYLRETWHPATCPEPPILDPGARPKWLRLKVESHRVLDRSHAEVRFVARYLDGGSSCRLHESSRFVRENGRWFYVDGDFIPKRD